MKRYALRNRSTGLYLSRRPKYGKREWVSLNDHRVALFTRKCDLSSAAIYLPEVKAVGRHFSWWRAEKGDYPVEPIAFNMFLIDEKVGALTAANLQEQQ